MPFILLPNYNKRNKKDKYISRIHGDEIKININSPEAFDEVFWKYILKNKYINKDLIEFHEINKNHFEKFQKLINSLLIRDKKTKYLSKNNNNIYRLETLSKMFKNSIFIIMFRHPLEQCNSLLRQHQRIINFQKEESFIMDYMDFLGHYEFGLNMKKSFKSNYNNKYSLNFWLENWVNTYQRLSNYKLYKNIYFLSYEDLIRKKRFSLEKFLNNDILSKINFETINENNLKNNNIENIDKGLLEKSLIIYKNLNSY